MDPDNPSQPRTTPGAAIPRYTNRHCSATSTSETIPTSPPVSVTAAAPAGAGNTTTTAVTTGGCAVVAARMEGVVSYAYHQLCHDDSDHDGDADVGQEIGDTGLVYDLQGDLRLSAVGVGTLTAGLGEMQEGKCQPQSLASPWEGSSTAIRPGNPLAIFWPILS
jgi:hypothetical protein